MDLLVATQRRRHESLASLHQVVREGSLAGRTGRRLDRCLRSAASTVLTSGLRPLPARRPALQIEKAILAVAEGIQNTQMPHVFRPCGARRRLPHTCRCGRINVRIERSYSTARTKYFTKIRVGTRHKPAEEHATGADSRDSDAARVLSSGLVTRPL